MWRVAGKPVRRGSGGAPRAARRPASPPSTHCLPIVHRLSGEVSYSVPRSAAAGHHAQDRAPATRGEAHARCLRSAVASTPARTNAPPACTARAVRFDAVGVHPCSPPNNADARCLIAGFLTIEQFHRRSFGRPPGAASATARPRGSDVPTRRSDDAAHTHRPPLRTSTPACARQRPASSAACSPVRAYGRSARSSSPHRRRHRPRQRKCCLYDRPTRRA